MRHLLQYTLFKKKNLKTNVRSFKLAVYFPPVLLLLCNLIHIRLGPFLGISIDTTVFRGSITQKTLAVHRERTLTCREDGASGRKKGGNVEGDDG